jgi:hypothetical protein
MVLMKRFLLPSFAAVLAVPAIGATPPAPSAKTVVTLQSCRTLADAAARLVCYDRAVDALSAATASGDVVIVERTEVRKARKGLFGFTLPRIDFLSGKPGNAEDAADEKELNTVITTSREIGYGKWRFTVEGGAIWETVEASMRLRDPVPGRKVLIERGSLGAYFVTVEKGGRVQAKRIG